MELKVVTTEGESDLSMGLMFMTKFDDDDLAQVRIEVLGKLLLF